jgi:hypothetical protein
MHKNTVKAWPGPGKEKKEKKRQQSMTQNSTTARRNPSVSTRFTWLGWARSELYFIKDEISVVSQDQKKKKKKKLKYLLV